MRNQRGPKIDVVLGSKLKVGDRILTTRPTGVVAVKTIWTVATLLGSRHIGVGDDVVIVFDTYEYLVVRKEST